MKNIKLNSKGNEVITIKPYSQKELAELYGVCSRTFSKWIAPFKEEIGPQRGRYFIIPQVKVIFEKLSYPSYIEID